MPLFMVMPSEGAEQPMIREFFSVRGPIDNFWTGNRLTSAPARALQIAVNDQ
jgi:hypothetical protein